MSNDDGPPASDKWQHGSVYINSDTGQKWQYRWGEWVKLSGGLLQCVDEMLDCGRTPDE